MGGIHYFDFEEFIISNLLFLLAQALEANKYLQVYIRFNSLWQTW